MRRTWIGVLLAATVLGSGTLAFLACGNNANDVAGCRYLEDIRCEIAFENGGCGLDPNFPLHAGSSTSDAITACKLYYEDACLHGFATSIYIEAGAITACASDIVNNGCNAVINPQDYAGCAWLNPIDAGIDAPPDVALPDVYVPDTSIADTGESADVTAVLNECYEGCNSSCLGDPSCITMCESSCLGQ